MRGLWQNDDGACHQRTPGAGMVAIWLDRTRCGLSGRLVISRRCHQRRVQPVTDTGHRAHTTRDDRRLIQLAGRADESPPTAPPDRSPTPRLSPTPPPTSAADPAHLHTHTPVSTCHRFDAPELTATWVRVGQPASYLDPAVRGPSATLITFRSACTCKIPRLATVRTSRSCRAPLAW